MRDVFCGKDVAIGGIADVLSVFDLDPDASRHLRMSVGSVSGIPNAPNVPGSGFYGGAYVTLIGHSTALTGHVVSPINPRALLISQATILAFVRGVQRLELASRARDKAGFNFYVIEFEQACNATKRGCTPGDLFTPRVESDWLSVRVRDDEDLKNTALDCRQCHQRGRNESQLLMRELENPWTHFFYASDSLPGINGSELVQDYLHAKDTETYGGIAAAQLMQSTPVILEGIAGAQPLVFNAPIIHKERWPMNAAGEYPPGPLGSPTWEAAYEAFKRGEQLALPYLEARATDPDKQAALTDAYSAFRSGELSAEDLPDLADIFPDDPLTRARIGLQTEPDAAPANALIQACGSCHNDVLDQGLSRARFNIDVSRLDRAALDLAIDRIELPRTAAGAMPPPEARQLDASAKARLIEYLGQAAPLAQDDALARAAQLGMAGAAK